MHANVHVYLYATPTSKRYEADSINKSTLEYRIIPRIMQCCRLQFVYTYFMDTSLFGIVLLSYCKVLNVIMM